MTSVVEESFVPRLVVDNTKGDRDLAREQDKRNIRPEDFVFDYSGTETIIESTNLFNALTREEGWNGL